MTVTRTGHDDFCPVCFWHEDEAECDYDCLCNFIADIRDNERRTIAHLLNPDQARRVTPLFARQCATGES